MMKHRLKTLAMAISLSGMVSTSAFSNTEVPHELQVTVSEQAYAVSYTAAELGLETSYQIVIEVIGTSHERIGLIELENPLYTQFEEFDEQTGEFISFQAQWFERGFLTLNAAQQAILNQGESFRAYTLDENGSVVELMLSGHKSMSSPRVRSAMTSAFKLIDNGSAQDKIDLVLLGDGYRADEKEKFRQDAASVMDGFFSKTPYRDYRDYFNVWLIEKPSQLSGVSENGSPLEGSAFKSYFRSTSDRLLLLKDRYQSIDEAKSVLPSDADEIYLVVSNTDKYGGAGYQNIATMTTSLSAVGLALHEVGHTYGKLADEYSYGNCNLNYEPSAKNVTMKSSDVKWSHWMEHDPEVGIFEGAQYCAEGKYRPTKNSLMRSLGSSREFDAVNTEALILKMYETIKPLASVSPTEQSIDMRGIQSFSVSTPIPSDRLNITWLLNGKVVDSGQNTQLTLNAEQLESGSHTLKAVVKDATSQVKSDPSGRLVNERQWQLNVADQTPDETGEGFRYVRLVADSEIKDQSFASAAELSFVDSQGAYVPTEQLSIVSVSSEETRYPRYAVQAIDGDPKTFWHSRWSESPLANPPHEMVIDLGGRVELSQINYLPRQDGNVNGTIKDYRLYVSNSAEQWSSPVVSGSFDSSTKEKQILIQEPTETNQAPNAIVTTDKNTLEGAGSLLLSGDKSTDPDGDSLVYQWQQIAPTFPLAVLETPTEANTVVRLADTNAKTTYRFSLTISDGELSDSAEVSVVQSPIPEVTQSPLWQAGKTYSSPCQRVTWQGAEWDNQWWTQGNEPGSDGQWGVWRKVNSSQNNQCK